MADPVRYLPPGLVDALRYGIGGETYAALAEDSDALWKLERVLEGAFADGYSAGHQRGYRAGYEAARARQKADEFLAAEIDVAEVQA